MDSIIDLRQQVLTEINQLPQDKLNLVLKFVNSLKYSSNKDIEEEIIDPLADFIGAVNTVKLTDNMDQDLYE